MNKIRHYFLARYSPDKILEEEAVQNKISICIYQSIGGSIHFDGGRKITINYQKSYQEEAIKFITFIKQSLEEEYNK